MEKLKMVDIRIVKRPALPVRQQFNEDELRSLTESIREKGIIVPLLVRPVGREFEIIDGDRRLEAAWRCKLEQVPVMARNTNASETIALRMLANLDRENPDPVSEANYIAKAIIELKSTKEDVAKLLHRTIRWIDDRLIIAEMPQQLQDALRLKQISLGVALELNRIDDEVVLNRYMTSAINDGMTIRGAEQCANQYEIMKESFKQTGEKFTPDVMPEAPPVVMVMCERCKTTGPISEMRVVRIHVAGCPVDTSETPGE